MVSPMLALAPAQTHGPEGVFAYRSRPDTPVEGMWYISLFPETVYRMMTSSLFEVNFRYNPAPCRERFHTSFLTSASALAGKRSKSSFIPVLHPRPWIALAGGMMALYSRGFWAFTCWQDSTNRNKLSHLIVCFILCRVNANQATKDKCDLPFNSTIIFPEFSSEKAY